jgi:enterochelin esterase-like enzyme
MVRRHRFGLGLGLSMLVLALVACHRYEEHLSYRRVESRFLRIEARYAVYLPPGFDPDHERLPLVLFLHGGGDDETAFDRFGLSAELDAAVREGRAPRAVILFPRGYNGFWVNWYDGTRLFQDYLVDELVPHVAGIHRTLPCPAHCHVMGVSMGGYGTLRLALDRPEAFASFSPISAPIFDTDQMVAFASGGLMHAFVPVDRIFGPPEPRARIARNDPYVRWTRAVDVHAGLFLAWGDHDKDGIVRMNRRFHRHLTEAGISHEAVQYEGRHRWLDWFPVIVRALDHQVGRVASDEPSSR